MRLASRACTRTHASLQSSPVFQLSLRATCFVVACSDSLQMLGRNNSEPANRSAEQWNRMYYWTSKAVSVQHIFNYTVLTLADTLCIQCTQRQCILRSVEILAGTMYCLVFLRQTQTSLMVVCNIRCWQPYAEIYYFCCEISHLFCECHSNINHSWSYDLELWHTVTYTPPGTSLILFCQIK